MTGPKADATLFDILGVTRSASEDEIRAAYKARVIETHPDKSGGSPQRFQQVQFAYEVLRDAKRRRQYLEELAARPKVGKRYSALLRPPPLDSVKASVVFNLGDGKPYTFETAPDKFRSKFRHGDVVRGPCGDQGIIVGLAFDGVYWCRNNCGIAEKLYSPEFGGDRDVFLIFREKTAPVDRAAAEAKAFQERAAAQRREQLREQQRASQRKALELEERQRRAEIEEGVAHYFATHVATMRGFLERATAAVAASTARRTLKSSLVATALLRKEGSPEAGTAVLDAPSAPFQPAAVRAADAPSLVAPTPVRLLFRRNEATGFVAVAAADVLTARNTNSPTRVDSPVRSAKPTGTPRRSVSAQSAVTRRSPLSPVVSGSPSSPTVAKTATPSSSSVPPPTTTTATAAATTSPALRPATPTMVRTRPVLVPSPLSGSFSGTSTLRSSVGGATGGASSSATPTTGRPSAVRAAAAVSSPKRVAATRPVASGLASHRFQHQDTYPVRTSSPANSTPGSRTTTPVGRRNSGDAAGTAAAAAATAAAARASATPGGAARQRTPVRSAVDSGTRSLHRGSDRAAVAPGAPSAAATTAAMPTTTTSVPMRTAGAPSRTATPIGRTSTPVRTGSPVKTASAVPRTSTASTGVSRGRDTEPTGGSHPVFGFMGPPQRASTPVAAPPSLAKRSNTPTGPLCERVQARAATPRRTGVSADDGGVRPNCLAQQRAMMQAVLAEAKLKRNEA